MTLIGATTSPLAMKDEYKSRASKTAEPSRLMTEKAYGFPAWRFEAPEALTITRFKLCATGNCAAARSPE